VYDCYCHSIINYNIIIRNDGKEEKRRHPGPKKITPWMQHRARVENELAVHL
jgi:hypothetical protein